MAVKIHHPASRAEWLELRKGNIGASEAAALLGVHEYQTAYGLWAQKSGLVEGQAEETPAMRRGRLLEPVAVAMLAEERPHWTIEANTIPGGHYFVDETLRLAATPDAFVLCPARGRGLVQIKSVEPRTFDAKWHVNDEIQAPLWIAVQAIVEAHLSGAEWAAVAAVIVGHGIQIEIIDVPLHQGIIDRVRAAAADFWASVAEGLPPDPDFSRDGWLIERFYRPTGTTIDLSSSNELPALLDERERLAGEKKAADLRLAAIRAELLANLGDASAAIVADGRTITAKRVERAAYQVKATSYVDLRVRQGGTA